MLPELGTFAIILAFTFSFIQMFMSLNYKKSAVVAQFSLLVFSMLILIYSFVTNDMSVFYVQSHSHLNLPLLYKIGAAWGGHEGSLLLWCIILNGWALAFILFSHVAKSFFAKILTVLGMLNCGFIAFLLFTSNPFTRIFPQIPIQGEDLVPVLQDPALIFHPPMLYTGYVGFAIAFAFGIAALMEGKFTKEWARECKPWVILPWAFLSGGIVLGSWWAYRELGWGGWWFWDPVENASLLPWLSATALLHTIIVTQQRGAFQGWSILLAIITFTLSLIGTFLVRSGVLVSVHAFASDPSRGIFLLAFLTFIIGGALLLYALKIKNFQHALTFKLFSREGFLLLNSILLLTAVITILLGTLYPIILDALNLEKISVGEPYFNTIFLPLILPILFFMGMAVHIKWEQHSFIAVINKIKYILLLSIGCGLTLPWVLGFPFHLFAWIGISLSCWIILATLQYAFRGQGQWQSKNISMILAHIGIAVVALAITINKTYSEERQVRMAVGENVRIANYDISLNSISKSQSLNHAATSLNFIVNNNLKDVGNIVAQQQIFKSHEQVFSKPGILVNPWRDIYVALGNVFADGSWSVRFYYKPAVMWIWIGGFLLVTSGLISTFNFLRKRYATS